MRLGLHKINHLPSIMNQRIVIPRDCKSNKKDRDKERGRERERERERKGRRGDE